MESSATGGDLPPSPSGGAPPPPPPAPPPPPPLGWLGGLVTGAGRLLAAVLGPDSSSGSGSGSTTTAAASDGASPSASSSPASYHQPHGEGYNGDHGNSPLFPPKNKFNQSEKESVLKDYAECSLAIVSEIEPKDVIMQLLMQETYSRSECNTLVKMIQERVVDSDSRGVDGGELALPINWKVGRQATVGYSSLSPNGSLPATSTIPIDDHGFDNNAAVGAAIPINSHDRGPSTHNADKIQSALKRSYSVARDTPEDIRRVRPKTNGNSLNISKFKQVDVIRNYPAANTREKITTQNHNAFEGFSEDGKKLLSDVPFLRTDNLTYSNIIAKVESADEKIGIPDKPSAVTPEPFTSSTSQAGDDQKNYDSAAIFSPTSDKDLKNNFPLKVEPLNNFMPLEQQMMDLSHQKHEYAVCDDSCSVSKLMFKEDIEFAPSLPVGMQLESGSKNRRRKAPTTPRATLPRSPVKGSCRKNNDVMVKSEIDLLEQSKLVLVEPQLELGDIPVKRPVGRPRKAK